MGGRLVVGVTGASGAIYAQRFLRAAAPHYDRIHVCVSDYGRQVVCSELGIQAYDDADLVRQVVGMSAQHLTVLDPRDLFSPPASGSFRHDGMVIVPCSMGTVGRIAAGVSNDLLTRAADVCLKEGFPLILVVRETPMSLVHLRNLTRLAEAGAVIVPASPSFYTKPRTIEDLADTIVARILERIGVRQTLVPEWQSDPPV